MSFISMLFTLGGSSRLDIPSLIAVRPIAVIFLAYGIYHLKRDDIFGFEWHLAFMLVVFFLPFIQALPLPSTIWQSLSGRDLTDDVLSSAGLARRWQPISAAPNASWNALSALIAPAAILFSSILIGREGRFQLIAIFLIIGLINIVIGILQAIGSSENLFYFYQIRAGNFPSGLFANRNHYAVFLSTILPMLAVYFSSIDLLSRKPRLKIGVLFGFGITIIPLILVTGSRAGLLTALLGIMVTPFLYRVQPSSVAHTDRTYGKMLTYIAAALGIATMFVLTLFAARAASLVRLFDDGGSTTSRASVWEVVMNITDQYGAFGSGVGSFAPIYQVNEPINLITFQYVPHAHNDFLEIALTTGWPGMVCMICFAAAYIFSAWCHFRADILVTREVLFGRLGVVIIGLLIIASIVDYPLRVPAMASLLVMAIIWASSGNKQRVKRVAASEILV
ncbi:O-antigen ligase family protein [Sphingorhabdus sp.]|jgi:O-antigen ligase|uniref:O-antigen ligase family protein n=1 Tax=Sphingorhabdus sp. TaxID=1902408 RepID=UPI0037CA4720